MGPDSGPVFGPTFSPFGMFSIHKKAQNRHFQNHNFFLANAATAASRKMLHTQKQRQRRHCVDNEPNFRYSEAPPALGKNLDNFWTQKRAYGWHRKFERQLAKLQACVENEKPTMETETIQKNFGNRQETDRKTNRKKSKTHDTHGNLHENGNLTLKGFAENGKNSTCSGETCSRHRNRHKIRTQNRVFNKTAEQM